MSRKHKIIVSIVGIFIILLGLVGITYGYFLTKISGNTNDNSIYITTANLRLVYSDAGDIGTIEAYDIKPGDVISEKTFTVTNEGNADIDEYRIYLENVVNTFVNQSDVRLTISCSSNKGNTCLGYDDSYPKTNALLISNSILKGEVHTYHLKVEYLETYTDQSDDMGKTLSGKIQIYNPKDIITISGTVTNYEDGQYAELHSEIKTSQILYNEQTGEYEYIFHGVTPGNHEIYIKSISDNTEKKKNIVISKGEPSISSDGTSIVVGDISEKALVDITVSESEITLVGKDVEKMGFTSDTLAYKIIENAKSGEDGRAVYSATPLTKVAEENSGETEAILSEEEDIYTETTGENSYYFRGNVIDNYVNFAGMCWRIMRIEGDGAIKIILEDKDAECNSEDYTGNFVIGKGNFGYDTTISENSWDIYTINYLHGTIDFENSMSSAFKSFQNNELSDYLSKSKYGNWCLDDTAYETSGVDFTTTVPLTTTEINEKYVSNTEFFYDSYVRLFGNNNTYGYSPTLKCNGTIMNDFEDSETNPTLMYVGGITADEVAYAGGKVSSNNDNYYLINDYKNNNLISFSTLSPVFISDGTLSSDGVELTVLSDNIFSIGYASFNNGKSYNNFFGSDTVSGSYFRPVITLKSGTEFVAGLGTKTAPYVIERKEISFTVKHDHSWDENFTWNGGTGISYSYFKAIEGMTWKEFINSNYNKNNSFSIFSSNENVVSCRGFYLYNGVTDTTKVNLDDVIISGNEYLEIGDE